MPCETRDPDRCHPRLLSLEQLALDRTLDILELAGDTRGGKRERILRTPRRAGERDS